MQIINQALLKDNFDIVLKLWMYPLMDIVAKELTLKGSFRFGKEFLSAVNWLENGRIDPLPLLSAEINIDNAEAAILLAADKTQSAKVQLTFD